jgi:hypothetical protein
LLLKQISYFLTINNMEHQEKLKLKQQELSYQSNPNKKAEIQNDIKVLKIRIEIDNLRSQIINLQAKNM